MDVMTIRALFFFLSLPPKKKKKKNPRIKYKEGMKGFVQLVINCEECNSRVIYNGNNRFTNIKWRMESYSSN